MIGKLERVDRIPHREQVEELDTALEAGGVLSRLWKELTNQRHVPSWFRDALALEQQATGIRAYEAIRIPGLSQTADYARSMIREGRITARPEEIDRVVETRTNRLPTIRRNHVALWFVAKEPALPDVVGDETVMREQLRHNLSLVEDGAIRVQILPAVRASIGMREPFRVMGLSAPPGTVRRGSCRCRCRSGRRSWPASSATACSSLSLRQDSFAPMSARPLAASSRIS